MIKEITGTRSYIIVDYGERKVKIQGELTLTPAFYGYTNSIKYWEPPYEKEEISESEKKTIIDEIRNYNNSEFKIVIEDW
jgi:hypothetical protein